MKFLQIFLCDPGDILRNDLLANSFCPSKKGDLSGTGRSIAKYWTGLNTALTLTLKSKKAVSQVDDARCQTARPTQLANIDEALKFDVICLRGSIFIKPTLD